MKQQRQQSQTNSFEARYPHISNWVIGGGWIEIGQDGGGYTNSLVRALDEGGMVYEGDAKYATLDAALEALDSGIRQWLEEHG